MTQDEFDGVRPRLVAEYAATQVRVSGWSELDAEANAERALLVLLPHGLGTPGMLFFTAEVHDAPAGMLWLGLTNQRGIPDTAWIYFIEVTPDRRGQGLGRTLLAAAELKVQEHGISTVGLNVLGENGVALDLYRSAGYGVVTQQMQKRVLGGPLVTPPTAGPSRLEPL